jgi:hypothetical protein
MSIDIKTSAGQIFNTFKSFVLTTVANESPEVIEAAGSFVADEEKGLKDLAEEALNGNLSYSFVIKRLEELKTDFVDALIAIEQIVASRIQSLINSLINMFENLLKSALLSLQ